MLNFDAVAIGAIVAVLGSLIVLVFLWIKAKQVIFGENSSGSDEGGCGDE